MYYEVQSFDGRQSSQYSTLEAAREHAEYMVDSFAKGCYGHDPRPKIFKIEPLEHHYFNTQTKEHDYAKCIL